MKKLLGITGLLLIVIVGTALKNPDFLSPYNLQNTLRWIALFGLVSVGVSYVIITGGIDLSIGSVVGLSGSALAVLLTALHWPVPLAVGAVLLLSLLIGVLHGLLVTKLGLQPFVVTLCGLLLYRGMARFITGDQSQGFGHQYEGLRQVAIARVPVTSTFAIPVPCFLLAGVAILGSILLHRSIWGRQLFAIGGNELAARFSGVRVDLLKLSAYVICSGLAGLAGILFALDLNSIQPSGLGEFYELYAVAAAVLGGCSLRGGEGTILGVLIGTALMRVLYNSINILGIPTHLEFAIIGAVILAGVVADEMVRRIALKRRQE